MSESLRVRDRVPLGIKVESSLGPVSEPRQANKKRPFPQMTRKTTSRPRTAATILSSSVAGPDAQIPEARTDNRQPCNSANSLLKPTQSSVVRLTTLYLPGDRGLTVDRFIIIIICNAWTGGPRRPIADWRFGSRKAPYKRTRYSARKLYVSY